VSNEGSGCAGKRVSGMAQRSMIYMLGTFLERIHRSHLYARHRQMELAMQWDRQIMMRYPEGPEDFDG
jgi:hypothetical protein